MASSTRNALKALNLAEHVEVIDEDFRRGVQFISEPVHFMFIDGAKNRYREYLEASLRVLARQALVVAHNTVSHADEVYEYLELRTRSSKRVSNAAN